MKKQLLTIIACVVALGATAQTSTGFHLISTLSAVDFRKTKPLNTYLGPVAKQNLNWGLEAGYFVNKLGVALTAQTDFDMDSPVLIGLKGYADIFRIENIVFKGELAAASFIKNVDGSNWQYKGAVSGSVALTEHFDAKAALQVTTVGEENFKKYHPGILFGIGYRF